MLAQNKCLCCCWCVHQCYLYFLDVQALWNIFDRWQDTSMDAPDTHRRRSNTTVRFHSFNKHNNLIAQLIMTLSLWLGRQQSSSRVPTHHSSNRLVYAMEQDSLSLLLDSTRRRKHLWHGMRMISSEPTTNILSNNEWTIPVTDTPGDVNSVIETENYPDSSISPTSSSSAGSLSTLQPGVSSNSPSNWSGEEIQQDGKTAEKNANFDTLKSQPVGSFVVSVGDSARLRAMSSPLIIPWSATVKEALGMRYFSRDNHQRKQNYLPLLQPQRRLMLPSSSRSLRSSLVAWPNSMTRQQFTTPNRWAVKQQPILIPGNEPPQPRLTMRAKISLDMQAAQSLIHWMGILSLQMSRIVGSTLCWLAPLVVSRRILNTIGDVGMDWYTGRYLRTTYQRISINYWQFYQGPAALRSASRWALHLLLLMTLGKVMEWMVGLHHPPCSSEHRFTTTSSGNISLPGCQWWCGALWMLGVIGTGHAGSVALGLWGGPFQIQPPRHPNHPHPNQSIRANLIRFSQILYDPDQWIRNMRQQRREADIVTLPLPAGALVFPSMWEPLWVLQATLILHSMSSCRRRMATLMRQVLIQQAFAEEWNKVLVQEKRLGLAAFVMLGYLCSTSCINWTIFSGDTLIGFAFLVSTLAYVGSNDKNAKLLVNFKNSYYILLLLFHRVMISLWMNIVVYRVASNKRDGARTMNTILPVT
jgi:hypothetical protein